MIKTNFFSHLLIFFFDWWCICISFVSYIVLFLVRIFLLMMITIIIAMNKVTFRIRFAVSFFVYLVWRLKDFSFFLVFFFIFLGFLCLFFQYCFSLLSSILTFSVWSFLIFQINAFYFQQLIFNFQLLIFHFSCYFNLIELID